MLKVCAFLAVASLAIGRGGGNGLDGNWRVSAIQCGSVSAFVMGVTSTLEIAGEVATTVDSVSGCAMTLGEIPVTTDGAGAVSINVGAAGSVSCDPDPCYVTMTSAAGTTTINCPTDLPPAGVLFSNVALDGDELTAQWAGCDYTWVSVAD